MLIDTLFDRLVSSLNGSRKQPYDKSPLTLKQGKMRPQKSNVGRQKSTFLDGAQNFVVNDSTFIEHQSQIIQNFAVGSLGADPVLERIATYANLDATMDSSARYPPPLCHPGTRLKIGDKLFNWLVNPDREWDMQWLHGPAGTGKSAVAQTFAERCDENGRLGACFFFSLLHDRKDPDTVVPTLIYQLAVCNPKYKSLVAAQIAGDPELLREKSRRAQFKKLVIEPFSHLQTQRHRSVRKPLLVILDGLDECEGENAQRDLIEMISEVVRLKKNFPLVWLICSRPESHLKYVFSRADFIVSCGREELALDAESIADVNFYLRDGLAGIKAEYRDVITPMWPSEEQIVTLSAKASGHFGFASTSLRYIGDPAFSAPMSQLDALLSFLHGIRVTASSPLKALDALYTRILSSVPHEALPTIQLVLGLYLHVPGSSFLSAQDACNFLHIDQPTFYNAFRKLHSVVNVPSPETASDTRLKFYHLSFEDYLQDPTRSAGFAISRESASLPLSKLYLLWYKLDLELFHTADGPIFNDYHEHGVLPGLTWISDDKKEEASRSVALHTVGWCWLVCSEVVVWDETFLSQVWDFDFRYIQADGLNVFWGYFLNNLWKASPDDFIRTEPRNEVDFRLLEYMKSMIGPWWRSQPATFPLELEEEGRGGIYFFLGRGVKAIVCWTTGLPQWLRFGLLNCDNAPSEKQISDYHARLIETGVVKGGDIVENGGEPRGSTE